MGSEWVEAIERTIAPPHEEFQATYVRIQIDTAGPASAKECSAFLRKLWFREIGKKEFVEIALPQPISLRDAPFEVFPMIPCLVDFAAAMERQDGDQFTVVRNWPYALRDKFGQPGTYKFMIAVHGPGGTKEKLAQIEWHGKRNTMRACDVIACPPNAMA